MKVTIDLGTADIEMQRSDGSWEKVEHCRTRVTVDGAVLKIDLAAVLTGEPLKEAKDSVGRASIITNAVPLPRSERPAPPSPPGPRSVSGTPPKVTGTIERINSNGPYKTKFVDPEIDHPEHVKNVFSPVRNERPAPTPPPPPKTSLLDGKSPLTLKHEHFLPPKIALPRKRFWWF